jgi:hypothetical protein
MSTTRDGNSEHAIEIGLGLRERYLLMKEERVVEA